VFAAVSFQPGTFTGAAGAAETAVVLLAGATLESLVMAVAVGVVVVVVGLDSPELERAIKPKAMTAVATESAIHCDLLIRSR